MLTNVAYAMGAGDAGGGGMGSLASFLPLILMFVVFYFLLIWPQQKKAKAHQEMINNLKKGDRVITSGGIYGVVTHLDDATATLEIADKVRIKVTRGSIAGLNVEAPAASSKNDNK